MIASKTLLCNHLLLYQSYEGAFGQGPGHEAHGGSTFCAVATLVLMNRLSDVLDEKKIYKLRRWCVMKQASGFQGRPNKEPDTCYSFWVGATLALLQSFHVISAQDNLAFLKTTEDKSVGGFAKYPEVFPGKFQHLIRFFKVASSIVSPRDSPFHIFFPHHLLCSVFYVVSITGFICTSFPLLAITFRCLTHVFGFKWPFSS